MTLRQSEIASNRRDREAAIPRAARSDGVDAAGLARGSARVAVAPIRAPGGLSGPRKRGAGAGAGRGRSGAVARRGLAREGARPLARCPTIRSRSAAPSPSSTASGLSARARPARMRARPGRRGSSSRSSGAKGASRRAARSGGRSGAAPANRPCRRPSRPSRSTRPAAAPRRTRCRAARLRARSSTLPRRPVWVRSWAPSRTRAPRRPSSGRSPPPLALAAARHARDRGGEARRSGHAAVRGEEPELRGVGGRRAAGVALSAGPPCIPARFAWGEAPSRGAIFGVKRAVGAVGSARPIRPDAGVATNEAAASRTDAFRPVGIRFDASGRWADESIVLDRCSPSPVRRALVRGKSRKAGLDGTTIRPRNTQPP